MIIFISQRLYLIVQQGFNNDVGKAKDYEKERTQ
jgi:hypothetical protein